MGQAIAVRTDYTAGEVRRLATRAKDTAQARRLLAIAAVLEGASREDAAPPGRGALGLDDLDHLAGLMHGMVRRPERHHVVGPSQADLAVRVTSLANFCDWAFPTGDIPL